MRQRIPQFSSGILQARSPNEVSSSCAIIDGTTPAAAGIITHRRGTSTRITGVVFEPNWV